jgi:hypothetical protein
MKYIIPTYILFIFFVSCENKSASNEQQAAPANPLFVTGVDTSAKTNPVAAGALNPKHGQPGHRCDIAEGAPLPNASIQPTITPAIPSVIETKKETPVLNTGTAAGLNPKHGDPGHRCDIAVGAPLNSKPN